MRTSTLLAAWSLAFMLLPAERVAGQDGPPNDKPYIFFSASPNLSSEAAPVTPLRTLNLRPNQDVTYFVYVHNPLKDKASVKVQLVSGPAGKLAVAAEKVVEVGGKQTVRVPLVADKAQLPPVLPPAIGADGKAVPAPAPAILLGTKPYIRAIVSDADGVLEEKGASIIRVDVGAYSKVMVSSASTDDTKLKIKVTREDVVGGLVGGPISVKLIPRTLAGEPIDPAKLAVEGNVLEGNLALAKDADESQVVELTLETKGLTGFAELSIDGFARHGWYTIDGKDAAAPFGIIAPAAAIPGKPIFVRFMAPKDGTNLKVVFDRTGTPAGVQLKSIPSPRNETTSVRIGDNGEAIFVTRSADWVVEFPTQGVFGKRNFLGRNGETVSKPTLVKFDASAPEVETLDAEPLTTDAKKLSQRMFRPGQKVRVFAAGKDAESEIDPSKGVVLYMGDKPGADGKPAPGSQVKAGKLGEDGRYSAIFEIPATTTVPEVKIGAIFVNGVGMPGGREAELKVDYTPPEVSILNFDPAKAPLAAYKPGDTVRLIASGFDPESGIDLADDVQFFLGDPPGPDGKPVQTTYVLKKAQGVIKGDKDKGNGQYLYAAELTLPKDIKKETEVKVGVMFVNRVGMYGTRVATVKLDKDFNTAIVKVKVLQGERRQPGIKVWLIDQAGAVAAEGKTDDCGIATFEKVLPGTYVVWGVKDADQNAQDFKTVVVRGGDEIDVDLSVTRKLSPPIQPRNPPQR